MNDGDRLARDPAMRWIVGGKAIERGGALTSRMVRFATELLASDDKLAIFSDQSGDWIDRVHDRKTPKNVVLDMDSSVCPKIGRAGGHGL